MRKSGGQIDEQVGFSKKVRDKDLETCNVIVDYKDQKVVKCIIEGKRVETTFDLLNDYYKKIYPELITQLSAAAVKN
jgi:hypothetical protein